MSSAATFWAKMIHSELSENIMKFARMVTNQELADLSDEWLNPTVDTRKYRQNVLRAFEVDAETFEGYRKDGGLCQIVEPNESNGNTVRRYFIA